MKINIGDWIITHDRDEVRYTSDVTLGKEYQVLGFRNWGERVEFIDDVGFRRSRPADRYQLSERTRIVKLMEKYEGVE